MASHSRYNTPPAPKTNAWKCPICKVAKKQPKILPCFHSFCQPCLETLAEQRNDGKLNCPDCHKIIKIPARGVAAFKVNVYIEQQKERPKFPCKNAHTKPRETELYCRECCSYICLECKLNGHLNHNTQKIESLVEAQRKDVTAKKVALDNKVASTEGKEKQFLKEQQNLKDKKAAVKIEILRRHKLMVETANRCRESALSTLESVTAPIDYEIRKQVADLKGLKDHLKMFQGRLERCLEKEEIDFLETAKDTFNDMRNLIQTFPNVQCITTLSRPILSFEVSADVTCKTQQQFLGPVLRKDMAPGPVDCTIEEVFRYGSGNSSNEVLSLFPKRNKIVWICYESSVVGDNTNNQRLQLYNCDGEVPTGHAHAISKTNFTDKDTDAVLCLGYEKPGHFLTYAKSGKHFMMSRNPQGQTSFISLVVERRKPLTISRKNHFTLQCRPRRSFDIDEGRNRLAVVEEATAATGGRRRVCLCRPPDPATIYVYEPPSPETFQPTDICFCKIQDREVLLVADELGDCVHVLHVDESRLVFLHYLAAGHPLLIQPTALNVDMAGDVWLACRGGAVLRLLTRGRAGRAPRQ